MHLKSGCCVLYTPIYRLTERKKFEFGRKVFLVDCLL